MALKLIGAARSRVYPCLWLAEEIGLDYERADVDDPDLARRAGQLILDPEGSVPALEDGALTLWDGYAINHYLARTYGGALGPRDPGEEGRILSWSFWTATVVDPPAHVILVNGFLGPEEERDPSLIAPAMERLTSPLALLERHFRSEHYLVAERFTVADVNLVSVLAWVAIAGGDLSPFPSTNAWLARCGGRPAAKRVLSWMGF